MVGAPSAIAFDWISRNLFIGNRLANNLEVVRLDGKTRHRTIILANDGNITSVADPKAICVDPLEGKLYWVDGGGNGVPQKVAKVNMDGSNPVNLVYNDIDKPEAIAIDLDSKTIYFSTIGNEPAIQSIDTYGGKRTTILSRGNNIANPKAIGVMGNRLYYLDPSYERLVQVALPSGSNERILLENQPELKTFTIFRKRPFVSVYYSLLVLFLIVICRSIILV